jgi:hypothetical protein
MYKYFPVLPAPGETIQDISYIRVREGRPMLEESLPAGYWESTTTNILCMILCILFVLFANEKSMKFSSFCI